jgi:hypothetical protein
MSRNVRNSHQNVHLFDRHTPTTIHTQAAATTTRQTIICHHGDAHDDVHRCCGAEHMKMLWFLAGNPPRSVHTIVCLNKPIDLMLCMMLLMVHT